MLESRTDAVPVVDRDGRLFGLITLWHVAALVAGGATTRPTGEG
jgi:CBS domain-containing protein